MDRKGPSIYTEFLVPKSTR